MAFDLVHYFAEQSLLQSPNLLNGSTVQTRQQQVFELNALVLGKLIQLWRKDSDKLFTEIQDQNPLYIQEIARHLTTSPKNQSTLSKQQLESSLSEILALQLSELKQLEQTGHLGKTGLNELMIGQIDHLSGQADDWVWSTNQLTELIGSKPSIEEDVSLDETMKEFNQMVHTAHHDTDKHDVNEVVHDVVPTWSKIVAPLVALAVLIFLYVQYGHLVG
ncbi:hypothetical protein [Acinetobacter soli]|uniref:Uncharacterized protein n=1 Tax=Acinetobacter soli NIPH 2899 TaxID=1217677 RepID=A0ABN0JZK5_9GAMM|nr:hypothetical protein [Acinetobacter soli]ENV61048.1 hypothetical protein F950_00293 [Acinetobacter soli NIPH 2899]